MTTPHECLHEDMLQDQSTKIAELEAKNGFKEQRIMELIKDNRRIESKIDKLTETVNKSILNSVQGDSSLKEEVKALKTQVENQNDVIEQYKEDARKAREEDRAKTDLKLKYVAIGISIVALALPYIVKLL